MGNVHMEATQINYRGGSKKMSVEEAIKAAGTEITPEEKTWIDSIPTLASGKADNDVIAPEFDSEAGVYAIGDLVMHEGKLYEFTTAHETAGDWDPTEVTNKTVADELSSLESGLTNYEATTNAALSVPENTGKNLIPLTLNNIKQVNTQGTWSGNDYVINGITYSVVLTNGVVTSITASGTASANANFYCGDYSTIKAGSYVLNGCASGGSESTYFMLCGEVDTRLATDSGYGSAFTISSDKSARTAIRVGSGYAITDTLTFYPMIRPASITDTAFVPYIPSVDSRLAALEAAIAQLINS